MNMQVTRSLFGENSIVICERELKSPGRSVTFLQMKRLSSEDELSKARIALVRGRVVVLRAIS